jgi:hypothetical protein
VYPAQLSAALPQDEAALIMTRGTGAGRVAASAAGTPNSIATITGARVRNVFLIKVMMLSHEELDRKWRFDQTGDVA